MICLGIDPGTKHCAFTLLQSNSIFELKDDSFVEIPFGNSFTVIKALTIQTTIKSKASIQEISKNVIDTLNQLHSDYNISHVQVEIQPFTGGSYSKRKAHVSYITRQSLLNVVVENSILSYCHCNSKSCGRTTALNWQNENKIDAKKKSYAYYKTMVWDVRNILLLKNEHEFDAMFIAKSYLQQKNK